jgi:hypothetical protein
MTETETMFTIRYRWQGQTYGTVESAPDAETAARRFRQINPHVEFISCEDGNAPDPDRPPIRCGHGPDSCPKMGYNGYCNARRCIYGLKANAAGQTPAANKESSHE